MSVIDRFEGLRNWFPVPTRRTGFGLVRWFLLEGDRYAVTAALLLLNTASLIALSKVWTFEIARLLTETRAVQTVLNSFLGGIILLVSIVVSINSIFLSYDITHVSNQQDRIEGAMEFRREVGRFADDGKTPSDPNTFLQIMAEVIHEHARNLEEGTRGTDEEVARDIREYVESVVGTAEGLQQSLNGNTGGDFGVLWIGLETDYGAIMDRSRSLSSSYSDRIDESSREEFEELIQTLELFVTGREYFKTLYYSREFSRLSRSLLLVSFPSIILTASTILAINAGVYPDVWLFGLPPVMMFVAVSFTVALAPFLVLTSFILRTATVGLETASAGPFVLRN